MPLVLIVDDEPDIREVIQINLEAAGFRVVTAGTGEAALAAVRSEAPDAMFLDVMMPGIDGFTVLEQLKAEANEDLSGIPVFMVTGMAAPEHRIRGGIEGALRYITKPFDPARLVAVITEVLDPGAPTERELRRKVQAASLEQLARLERGDDVDLEADLHEDRPNDGSRVRLTRLESLPEAAPAAPRLVQARERMGTLTDKQRELLEALAGGEPVTAVADRLEMSRSNIYSGLRRIARRLGLEGSDELLAVLRQGMLFDQPTS
jgi:two-component system alkaline phosphatase synthesis response regulator PhoP